MKKDTKNMSDVIRDYDNPQAQVGVLQMDYLIGQVFTHSELLGLTDRQLSAYKKTLRDMFWDWYNSQLPNPSGLADISHQARLHHGIEQLVTNTTGITYASGKTV